MRRAKEPWFRTGRGWFTQHRGKKVFLGQDKQTAQLLFHQLMATGSVSPPVSADAPIITILDAYLEWLDHRVREGSKSPRTFAWYKKYLQDFSVFQTEAYRVRDLAIDRLEPFHIYQWVDSHTGWKTGKRGAMTAVQRAFNWAARAGLPKSIGGKSPVAHLEKPPQGRREQLVSVEEYQETLALVNDQEFRDLVELAWETGCRPHELFTVQAAYVDLAIGIWTFPIRLSKGRRIQRVVYLSDRALEISRRLVPIRSTGPLLLNTDGQPWCVSSVKCRFQKICRELGRRRLREGTLLPPKVPRLTVAARNDPKTRPSTTRKFLPVGVSSTNWPANMGLGSTSTPFATR